jgi:hypothetical protein
MIERSAHAEMVWEVYVDVDKTRALVRHEVGLATLEKKHIVPW